MPIIASAAKKLRQDKKQTSLNKKVLIAMKKAVKKARTSSTVKNIQAAYSALDTAAKKNVIHKNKANRLKSRLLSKQLKTQSSKLKTTAKS